MEFVEHLSDYQLLRTSCAPWSWLYKLRCVRKHVRMSRISSVWFGLYFVIHLSD